MDTRTKQSARQILAANLRALMGSHSRLNNRPTIAAAAGKEISERTVGTYLEGTGNPTLSRLEIIAKLYGVEPWELLFDPDKSRDKLIERLFGKGAK